MSISYRGIFERLEIVPIVGTYFVLYGTIYAVSYYGFFEVSILGFIGLGELFFYVIRDATLFLYSVVVIVIALKMGSWSVHKREIVISKINEKIESIAITRQRLLKELETTASQPIRQRKMKGLKRLAKDHKRQIARLRFLRDWVAYSVGSSLIAMIVFITYSILNDRFFDAFIVAYIIVFHTLALFGGVYNANGRTVILSILVLLLLSFPVFTAKLQATKILKTHGLGLDFIVNGQLVKSDSSAFVIGQTERFIFYHNPGDSSTIAFPIEKIDRLILN